MDIFIDTNIYLSFYDLTSDDLEELRKLLALIDKEKIRLLVPSQVLDEFWRNRENKISTALGRFRNHTVSFQYPAFSKDYSEYKELKKLQKQFERTHEELEKQVKEDVRKAELGADKVIDELFEQATIVDSTQNTVFQRAKRRVSLGNPPGKQGSLGDALNWEALLSVSVDAQGLNFISGDKDFFSPLDANKLHDFLLKDWQRCKEEPIIYYKSLSQFFRDKFPSIQLASEVDTELVIHRLLYSGAYSATHEAIAELSKFTSFTDNQVTSIVDAGVSNDQVYQIMKDRDVSAFYKSLIKKYKLVIDEDKLLRLNEYLGENDEISETN